MLSREELIALVENAYFSNVDNKNLEPALACFAEDAELRIQSAHVSHTGRDQIGRMFRDFMAATKDHLSRRLQPCRRRGEPMDRLAVRRPQRLRRRPPRRDAQLQFLPGRRRPLQARDDLHDGRKPAGLGPLIHIPQAHRAPLRAYPRDALAPLDRAPRARGRATLSRLRRAGAVAPAGPATRYAHRVTPRSRCLRRRAPLATLAAVLVKGKA